MTGYLRRRIVGRKRNVYMFLRIGWRDRQNDHETEYYQNQSRLLH
jgi:hypothetical protein